MLVETNHHHHHHHGHLSFVERDGGQYERIRCVQPQLTDGHISDRQLPEKPEHSESGLRHSDRYVRLPDCTRLGGQHNGHASGDS